MCPGVPRIPRTRLWPTMKYRGFWVGVSNMFYLHPYLGKITILTNIFQRGWNHQLEVFFEPKTHPRESEPLLLKRRKDQTFIQMDCFFPLSLNFIRMDGFSTETPEIQEGRHFFYKDDVTSSVLGDHFAQVHFCARWYHIHLDWGWALLGCPRKLVFNA